MRRDVSRLRQPRRLLAIALVGFAAGIALAFVAARGELAGADARAYWAAVRIWLAGGDPYHPPAPFMPYPYAPWLLPLLTPLGLLPWDVAWFGWRWLNVLLLAWSAAWAYRRHPLATAAVLAVLMPSIAVTLDTGNINLVLALAIWAAQFAAPRAGGAIWALTVSTKWFPVLLFGLLPPRTRLCALGSLGVAIVLSLATFPQTLTWIQTMVAYPRPLRIDYLVLLWAGIPWLWRHPQPLAWLQPRQLQALVANRRRVLEGWWHGLRRDPEAAALEARQGVQARVRGFFGAG
ncbi:MAG: glycosyltransferase 87 family protein [Chloroflexota bacterium]|nr:glycosyltransferase 87 family protein [Chloroflexota bacterium]